MEKSDYYIDKLKSLNLGENRTQELENKIRKILKRIEILEQESPKEGSYIKEIFTKRLEEIDKIQYGDLNNREFLNSKSLFEIGITIDENGVVNFRKLDKVFLGILQDFQNKGILKLDGNNIPIIQGEIDISKKLEIIKVIDDYISFLEGTGKAGPEIVRLKKQIEEIKKQYGSGIEKGITDLCGKITKKDAQEYINSIENSISCSKNLSPEEKSTIIKEIKDWFLSGDNMELKIAIMVVIGTIGIIALGPIIGALGTAISGSLLRVLVTFGASQRIFPFLLSLVPGAGKMQLNSLANFNGKQNYYFYIGGTVKDFINGINLQGLFGMFYGVFSSEKK